MSATGPEAGWTRRAGRARPGRSEDATSEDDATRDRGAADGAAHETDVAAWRRRTAGERRWPVSLAVLVAIGLQLALPDRLGLRPAWLLPGIEAVLLVALTVANPDRLDRRHPALRAGSLALIAVVALSNAVSAGLLVHELVQGRGSAGRAGPLLTNGATVYLTNVLAFALLYWDFDRGGPVARTYADQVFPDLLFPQMATDGIASRDWEPTFLDYLYVSLTNATAFSPTDTLPLSRWAKVLMAVQSLVALAVVGLVVARAVNALP